MRRPPRCPAAAAAARPPAGARPPVSGRTRPPRRRPAPRSAAGRTSRPSRRRAPSTACRAGCRARRPAWSGRRSALRRSFSARPPPGPRRSPPRPGRPNCWSPDLLASLPGQMPGPVGESVDLRSTGEGADLQRVAALLARGQVLQLAPGAGVQPAGVPVGTRLHRHHVRPRAELAPGDVMRERGPLIPLVYPDPGGTIDDRGADHAVGTGGHVVLVAFLDEV